ncbi:MAG: chromosome segregation protein SMC [Ectothiorhodospiraceae bacterium]|nr:chromosome segregation protein SMC [Ectothiorhodospiraceae bacterium]
MRLRKLKLAGFKSFVDPTTISLPGDLIGVVGPNGCGKSNIIDAVRWVMGEISAKHLRGDTMADVVFTGSNTRKPVSQASVELVFDNSEGRLGGRYAAYAEVSVRRQVDRESQSVYFINGVRCRRRDVMDVFLGTGLGPRSYAIIEQGMISRLIEARPEELREFLEEAAGISKYKERRRETENRMRHTQENLDRLSDLREELGRQLTHLKRQATIAERYKVLKDEERGVRAELLALRWRGLDAEATAHSERVGQQQNALEAALAELRRVESELERTRSDHAQSSDDFNEAYRAVLDAGAEVARREETIQSLRTRREELRSGLAREEAAAARAREHIATESERLRKLEAERAEREPQLEGLNATATEARTEFRRREEAMQSWQERWEELTEQAAEPSRVAHAEQARIQGLEANVARLRRRIEDTERELGGLDEAGLATQVEAARAAHAAAEQAATQAEQAVSARRAAIAEARRINTETDRALAQAREQFQTLRGRVSSITALQEAALGKGAGAGLDWLRARGLDGRPRLAEALRAAEGWETAVEAVLGDRIDAVCVDDLAAPARALDQLGKGAVGLFSPGGAASPGGDAGLEPLAARVQAPWALGSLLAGVYCAGDVEAALAARHRLGPTECLVTPDGVRVGPDWLRVERADAAAGVLRRERELRERQAELERARGRVGELEAARAEGGRALEAAEAALAEAQSAHAKQVRHAAECRSEAGAASSRLDQLRNRAGRLRVDLDEARRGLAAEDEVLAESRDRLERSSAEARRLSDEREAWSRQRDHLRDALDAAREHWQAVRDEVYEIGLRVESVRAQIGSLRDAVARERDQASALATRIGELREGMERTAEPLASAESELAARLAARSQLEGALAAARTRLEDIDARARELDGQREGREREVERERRTLEDMRLGGQEIVVRRRTVEEQLAEAGADLQALLEGLGADATEPAWSERLEELERRIQRLGPINLAAIDEFEQQSERKQYLDSQHADLEEALGTLRSAIQKIDRETRARFKETYEKVNDGLGRMFPRLFGGGHASLEMTGEDLLDTGVAVMARPPGKRNASIHLLSGGEKALSAIALVFSIFELNPAPFCLLDEVDAPLDDANVVRFSQLVKDMSERVQFLVVTHNKITMEIAQQLVGVTMNEPGVSRLVAVDLDEAVDLAAV